MPTSDMRAGLKCIVNQLLLFRAKIAFEGVLTENHQAVTGVTFRANTSLPTWQTKPVLSFIIPSVRLC